MRALAILAILSSTWGCGSVPSNVSPASGSARPDPDFQFRVQEGPSDPVTHGGPSLVVDGEMTLLRAAIEDASSRFPPEMKRFGGPLFYVIDHRHAYSRQVEGWSSEDDLDYQYPDHTLYPKGTIKVNFGEKFMSELELFSEADFDSSPQTRVGAKQFAREVIVHETLHARQFQDKPVRDLSRTASSVVNGIADAQILSDTREKIKYEHAAFFAGRSMLTPGPQAALAKAIEDYASAHPDRFLPGAKYALLNPAELAKGLRARVLLIGSSEFSHGAHIILDGQVEVPQAALDLKILNDQLESGSALSRESPTLLQKRVRDIVARHDEFVGSDDREALSSLYTYIASVEIRYRQELARFSKWEEGHGTNHVRPKPVELPPLEHP